MRRTYLVFLVSTVNLFHHANAEPEGRAVQVRPCQLDSFNFNCCVNVPSSKENNANVCVGSELVPNELALKTTVKFDDIVVFTGQLGPNSIPICLPNSPLCLTVNHVDVQKRQICTKVAYAFLTLAKFPCVGIEDGSIQTEENVY